MKALLLEKIHNFRLEANPLRLADIPRPEPKPNEILIKVNVCGICHTELDEIEGRTPPIRFPMVLGHQVVGIVEKTGKNVSKVKAGERVGVAWIFSACGQCDHCLRGEENLCEHFSATGRDAPGGYAEYMCVHEDFAHQIPATFKDAEAAPLLCAGAIGYRSVHLTRLKNGQSLGLAGFGASAHLVLKMVKHCYPDSKVFVFARNESERKFAIELGAAWAGDTMDAPPELLNAIIDTTPAWKPIVEALRHLNPGGRLVINAIRKENYDKDYLQNLDYPAHLWLEKEIKSVANVTRADVREFLRLAANIPIHPEYQEYPLEEANNALRELKQQKIRGAKVLRVQ